MPGAMVNVVLLPEEVVEEGGERRVIRARVVAIVEGELMELEE